MPIDTTPRGIAAASACFVCQPEDTQRAEMIYLLAQLAGNTMTPAQLAAASKCYCYSDRRVAESVMVYLLQASAAAAGA